MEQHYCMIELLDGYMWKIGRSTIFALRTYNAGSALTKSLCVCSAYSSSMEALKQPTIRVVAIIAEGVPEADAKRLIAYARANNKVLK